jgi:hypothetical protein
MREARSNPPPALPAAPAPDNRVVALEREVRALRRALYAAAVLVVLLLMESLALIANFPRH